MNIRDLRIVLGVASLICWTVPVAVAVDEETKSDKERLQGTWVLLRGESNGNSLATLLEKQGLRNLQVTFAGDTMKMSGFGRADFTYTFKLQSEATPKAIDSVAKNTQGKAAQGTRVPGIYKIDGETLTLCLANGPGIARPKRFEAPKDSQSSLLTLTRAKP